MVIINKYIFDCVDKYINEINKIDTDFYMNDYRSVLVDKTVVKISKLYSKLRDKCSEEEFTKFTICIIGNIIESIINNRYVLLDKHSGDFYKFEYYTDNNDPYRIEKEADGNVFYSNEFIIK